VNISTGFLRIFPDDIYNGILTYYTESACSDAGGLVDLVNREADN
jgi:hypothetical protein